MTSETEGETKCGQWCGCTYFCVTYTSVCTGETKKSTHLPLTDKEAGRNVFSSTRVSGIEQEIRLPPLPFCINDGNRGKSSVPYIE